ncbi:MAG: class I SAM-dependent methyltransferase [Pseudomonadota bacterium]
MPDTTDALLCSDCASFPQNPNTIPAWDALWAKTGFKSPEQPPVDERKKAVASFVPCGSSVLDVACGAGQISGFLHDSVKYIGLDFSRQTFRLNPGNRIQADVRELPIKDKSVPVVIAMEIIEHLTDPYTFIRDLVRIARNLVILTVPDNRQGPEDEPFHLTKYDRFSLYQLIHDSVFPSPVSGLKSSGTPRILISKTELNLIGRIEL